MLQRFDDDVQICRTFHFGIHGVSNSQYSEVRGGDISFVVALILLSFKVILII